MDRKKLVVELRELYWTYNEYPTTKIAQLLKEAADTLERDVIQNYDDKKYLVRGVIAKKSDGKLIPPAEPIVIFRAQDALLPEMLLWYQEICRREGAGEGHLQIIDQRIQEILAWQENNSIKIPDTP